MENQCSVQLNIEFSHRAQMRKEETSDSFIQDWTVSVQGPQTADIQQLVEKVVFHLHESYPSPKRVCKKPPYSVAESGSAGFLMRIEVYFKNKAQPKKVCFKYDLVLNPEGEAPVDHRHCEKFTFSNPNKDFKRKLIKAGGIIMGPESAESGSRTSSECPSPPTKKIKKCDHVSEETSKE